MGDEADFLIERYYLSERACNPLRDRPLRNRSFQDRPTHPTTTRAAIADKEFKIAVVLGGKEGPALMRTNRLPGTKLIVCDNTEDTFWVWASSGITGIHKGSVKVVENGLSINEALSALGRKPYTQERDPGPHPDWSKPITQRTFHVAQVRATLPGQAALTALTPGTRLIVCEQDKDRYWVWACGNLSSIAKRACKVVEADLTLTQAHERLGRPVPAEAALSPRGRAPAP